MSKSITGFVNARRFTDLTERHGCAVTAVLAYFLCGAGRVSTSTSLYVNRHIVSDIADSLRMKEETVTAAMRTLHDNKLIFWDSRTGFVFVREYWKHNSFASPKIQQQIARAVMNFSSRIGKDGFEEIAIFFEDLFDSVAENSEDVHCNLVADTARERIELIERGIE